MSVFRRPRWLQRPWWERPAGVWPPPAPAPPILSSQARLRAVWLAIDRQLAFHQSLPEEDRNVELIDALLALRLLVLPPTPEPGPPVIPGRSS